MIEEVGRVNLKMLAASCRLGRGVGGIGKVGLTASEWIVGGVVRFHPPTAPRYQDLAGCGYATYGYWIVLDRT